jgi:GNAT superfamily N-acetyltransferase
MPEVLFATYYQEHQHKTRTALVAENKTKNILGYLTILWKSPYPGFSEPNIPKVNDLNVIPSCRGKGVASKLMNSAKELVANKYNKIGLGVRLYEDYGQAQSLYVQRGSVPNKAGITYNLEKVTPGESYCIDDECLLWLVKKLDMP